jgi:hypothetical protein
MNLKFLVKNVGEIIINPVKRWETIHSQDKSISYLLLNLLFPLILLTSVSAFLGSLLLINPGLSIIYSIITGIKYLLLYILSIFGTVFIFTELCNILIKKKDFRVSFKIIAYSIIPLILCQILSLFFESLIFVNILALFGLYICWTGVEIMLYPAPKQKVPLLAAATISFIVLFTIFSWLLNTVSDKIYFTFFA